MNFRNWNVKSQNIFTDTVKYYKLDYIRINFGSSFWEPTSNSTQNIHSMARSEIFRSCWMKNTTKAGQKKGFTVIWAKLFSKYVLKSMRATYQFSLLPFQDRSKIWKLTWLCKALDFENFGFLIAKDFEQETSRFQVNWVWKFFLLWYHFKNHVSKHIWDGIW